MVNKNLFKTGSTTPAVPAADTQNNAGGKAYKFDKKHCLAQIAATNCFNGTFYASADSNLKLAKDAVEALKDDPEFIAKVAVYSRDKGYMKDMPAYLCAVLAGLDKKLFRKVFRKVIDNGKMLRNVIQIARSGQAGKVYNMSSGTFRHALQEWFDNKSPASIFKASIGNDPSMRDILRMARPAPRNQQGEYSADKAALFAYLLDAELKDGEFLVYKGKGSERKVAYRHAYNNLPELVLQYEAYKKDKSLPVPNVDFRFLDHLVDDKGWATIAENAGWTMTRMNLKHVPET
jgi:60 kDa SS-A/Ro ribonucleoprotein